MKMTAQLDEISNYCLSIKVQKAQKNSDGSGLISSGLLHKPQKCAVTSYGLPYFFFYFVNF